MLFASSDKANCYAFWIRGQVLPVEMAFWIKLHVFYSSIPETSVKGTKLCVCVCALIFFFFFLFKQPYLSNIAGRSVLVLLALEQDSKAFDRHFCPGDERSWQAHIHTLAPMFIIWYFNLIRLAFSVSFQTIIPWIHREKKTLCIFISEKSLKGVSKH